LGRLACDACSIRRVALLLAEVHHPQWASCTLRTFMGPLVTDVQSMVGNMQAALASGRRKNR